MKTLIFLLAAVTLVSCDVYYVEPVPVVVYDARDQFIGDYDINEYSSTYDEYWEYGVTIYKGSRNEIVIDNFYNSGLKVYATIDGTSLYIPWQTVNGYEINGDGYVEGSKLVINYKVRDTLTKGAPWDFCNATGWLY